MDVHYGLSTAHKMLTFPRVELEFDAPVRANFSAPVLRVEVCRVWQNKYHSLSANRSRQFYAAQGGIKSCGNLGFKK